MKHNDINFMNEKDFSSFNISSTELVSIETKTLNKRSTVP